MSKIPGWNKDGRKNRWHTDVKNGSQFVIILGRDVEQSRMFGKLYYRLMFYEYKDFIDGFYDIAQSKVIAEGTNKADIINAGIDFMRRHTW